MTPRRPYLDKANPDVYKAMLQSANKTKEAGAAAGLTPALTELINTRVSQINGCVACLSIHTREARQAGVPQLKLDVLAGWRDSKAFDAQEKVALLLAESLTNIDLAEDLDVTVEYASQFFTKEQITAIEWTVILINSFNRISIASGHPEISQKN